MRSSSGEARYAPVVSASAEVDAEGRVARAAEIAARLLENIETVVHGKSEEIRLVLAALVCGGHVLFEDVPGHGEDGARPRDRRSRSRARSPSRIQCTPDLQPTDVTGLSVYNQGTREFEFRPGPIFANVVLVDEINRAMPKTQSALLEAMAEQQVTVDGVTRRLPDPFLLLATENPIEHEGTFPLPEAQLDRFFLATSLGYPAPRTSCGSIDEQRGAGTRSRRCGPVVTVEEVDELRARSSDVYVDDAARASGSSSSCARRASSPRVAIGASVRGSLALERAARGWALLHERDYVTPDDVEQLFLPVLGHRIVFTPAFLAETRRARPWDARRSAEFRRECLRARAAAARLRAGVDREPPRRSGRGDARLPARPARACSRARRSAAMPSCRRGAG